MSRVGGKRKGAGNKTGSVRPNFCDYLTPKEIKNDIKWVKENWKTDPQLKLWYLDHVFGKAVQPIANDGGRPLIVQFDNAFTRSTEENRRK